MPWISPPTLYKARNVPHKQPVCAICVDRTRGRTERVQLTHRVSVWLCADHASATFQTRRGGRDFVRTLAGVWKANDCLTAARDRALAAHLDRLTQPPRRDHARAATHGPTCAASSSAATPRAPPRPSSRPPSSTAYADCPARPPSRRTIQRWHAQRRWLAHAP